MLLPVIDSRKYVYQPDEDMEVFVSVFIIVKHMDPILKGCVPFLVHGMKVSVYSKRVDGFKLHGGMFH